MVEPPEVKDAHQRIHEGLGTECPYPDRLNIGCVERDCAYMALDVPLP